MQELIALFRKYTGHDPSKIQQLPSSGSHRKYIRLFDADKPYMGVCGTDARENGAFFAVGESLGKVVNVPKVLAVSDDRLRYLQEDLGDDSLYSLISRGREKGLYDEGERKLLCKTMSLLPDIQFAGAQGLDFTLCYPDSEFNARMVEFDLNYFKYCFLKAVGAEFDEVLLQDDFDSLKKDLLQDFGDTFMYRDFQARNVMIHKGEPYFIDFQGGRRGPIYYDVASFVWQARACYDATTKEMMIDAYLESLQKYVKTGKEEFMERLRLFVLFRTLQVLGAYGFRGLYEQKAHFIESIPYALDNLAELLETPFTEYPYLQKTLEGLISGPRSLPRKGKDDTGLEVNVISFSFKKGLPRDMSGNGGGYIFDCRAVHNPGRYDEYKALTGLDGPVADFIEGNGELPAFLEKVYSLVDAHVERYLKRGFTHLQVAFGCTGGQHRSVYSAQRVAEHLKEKYNIRILLEHRELGIRKEL